MSRVVRLQVGQRGFIDVLKLYQRTFTLYFGAWMHDMHAKRNSSHLSQLISHREFLLFNQLG